jgi:hypothetical protein
MIMKWWLEVSFTWSVYSVALSWSSSDSLQAGDLIVSDVSEASIARLNRSTLELEFIEYVRDIVSPQRL